MEAENESEEISTEEKMRAMALRIQALEGNLKQTLDAIISLQKNVKTLTKCVATLQDRVINEQSNIPQ